MLDLDSFLVSLYVLVDDWWKLEHSSEPPKAGRPALLTDPEVITLAILAQWPRFRSERDFWRFAWAHLRPYFPKLCSQSQLNRRVRSVEPDLRDFQRALARTLCGVSEVYLASLRPHSHPGHREGEGFSQGAVCRAGHLREECLQDRVGLRVQGGTLGQPRGRYLCAFGLAEAASDDRPIGEFLIIEDSQETYLAYPRALRAFSGSDAGWISMERW